MTCGSRSGESVAAVMVAKAKRRKEVAADLLERGEERSKLTPGF